MYCYEGTNITGEKVVNRYKTQLNDALIESYTEDAVIELFLRVLGPFWCVPTCVCERPHRATKFMSLDISAPCRGDRSTVLMVDLRTKPGALSPRVF